MPAVQGAFLIINHDIFDVPVLVPTMDEKLCVPFPERIGNSAGLPSLSVQVSARHSVDGYTVTKHMFPMPGGLCCEAV